MPRPASKPAYNNNLKANIKTRQFGNKKEDTKKFFIASNSQRPTTDFNQKKQFLTSPRESFVERTQPVTFSSDLKEQNIKTKVHYDPFEGYEDYEEDRTYFVI